MVFLRNPINWVGIIDYDVKKCCLCWNPLQFSGNGNEPRDKTRSSTLSSLPPSLCIRCPEGSLNQSYSFISLVRFFWRVCSNCVNTYTTNCKVIPMIFKEYWIRNSVNKLDMLTPQDLWSVAYWYRRISMSASWCYFQCANCHVCILMLFRHEQTFLVSVFGKWGSTRGYRQWLTPGLI